MGNCISGPKKGDVATRPPTEMSRTPSPVTNIGNMQEKVLRIPEQRVGDETLFVRHEDLDAQTLKRALTLTARHIHEQGQNLTIIAIGGLTNTVLLRNRRTTHDVDFLGANIANYHRRLLGQAAKQAEMESSVPLGKQWFNNELEMVLSSDVRELVTRHALAQNEVVFQAKGLKVIAAPWNFAFIRKTIAISQSRGRDREYDHSDAAAYIHRYVQKQHGQPVTEATIREWARWYQVYVNPVIVTEIAQDYRKIYKKIGIVEENP
jgi:hypothetical protein